MINNKLLLTCSHKISPTIRTIPAILISLRTLNDL